MDLPSSLAVLAQNMNLEPDGEIDCQVTHHGLFAEGIPISKAVLPNGKQIKLLKTMLTSVCEKNCIYCPFQAGRNYRRATFSPDELAHTFMRIFFAKVVEGLFLSSGVLNGGMRSQDKLIDTADILRSKYDYRGYIHLKLMPGIEKDQLERAMMLASRVSINLEAPNEYRLKRLAPKKNFIQDLIRPLKWAKDIRREKSPHKNWNGLWPSSTTQFVVGAVGETDMEIVSASEKLFSQLDLKRIYYSKFNPIEGTPLENHPAENPWRSYRLYQSSYLIRDYGYTLEDMPFDQDGNLPLEIDPKLAWAKKNLVENPIEINKAEKEELVRIPGIGHLGVRTILQNRRDRKLNSIGQLKKMGVGTKNTRDFILIDGKRPARQTSFL